MKGRVATEWTLTEFPDDTAGVFTTATKDFMRWTGAENSNNSPTGGTQSPASVSMALRRDRVA